MSLGKKGWHVRVVVAGTRIAMHRIEGWIVNYRPESVFRE